MSCDDDEIPHMKVSPYGMCLSAQLGDVTLAAAHLAADIAEELRQVSPQTLCRRSALR